jgi:hypothetical protein
MTYKTYGTPTKDKCPSEAVEMSSFFNRLRAEYSELGRIALHIRNEGLRTHQQVQKMRLDGGFVPGASDVVIPGAPAFVMEMKSRAKTAKVSKEQVAYLEACESAGAFCCVALGAVAAWEALSEWLNQQQGKD